jgi:hypothetical protein
MTVTAEPLSAQMHAYACGRTEAESAALRDFYRYHAVRAEAVHGARSKKALLGALGLSRITDASTPTRRWFAEWEDWRARRRTVRRMQKAMPDPDESLPMSEWVAVFEDVAGSADVETVAAETRGMLAQMHHLSDDEAAGFADELDATSEEMTDLIDERIHDVERWLIMLADQQDAHAA